MAKELKVKVEGSTAIVAQVAEKCEYGSVSYPSGQAIYDYVQAHPAIKQVKLEGTDIVFDATLAFKTIGTKVTKGNKVANGVDPSVVNATGGKGGGSRGAKVSVRLDGDSVIFSAGEAIAKASKDITTFDARSTATFASKVMRIVESMRSGSDEALKPLLGQPRLVAKLGGITVEMGEGEITPELKAKAAGALVTEAVMANRIDLVAKIGEIVIESVGGESAEEYLKLFA